MLGTAGNFTCTRTRCADDLDEENNLKLRFQVGIDHFRSATGQEGMLERVINKPAVSLYLWSTNIFDTIFLKEFPWIPCKNKTGAMQHSKYR